MIQIGINIAVKGESITSPLPPVNTIAPVISGTMVVGQTLTTTDGTWTNSPTSFTYQWYNGITAILGATSSIYILVQADAGTTTAIKCEVTAINLFGSTVVDSNTLTTVYDADAQAFITAAVITVLIEMTAINELTIGLKANNLWTKIKALYPFVGGTSTTHKYNLKDPRDLDAAFRLVFNGGWTHSSTGATPNGTNAYADTKLKPSVLTSNSTHLSYYSRINNTTNAIDMGVRNASNNSIRFYIYYLGIIYSDQYNDLTGRISGAAPASNKLLIGTRTSASSHKIYRNGVALYSNATSGGSLIITESIYIGAANYSGIASFFTNRECAFSSIGDGLNDTEAFNFNTIVQAYQTTLSRQV